MPQAIPGIPRGGGRSDQYCELGSCPVVPEGRISRALRPQNMLVTHASPGGLEYGEHNRFACGSLEPTATQGGGDRGRFALVGHQVPGNPKVEKCAGPVVTERRRSNKPCSLEPIWTGHRRSSNRTVRRPSIRDPDVGKASQGRIAPSVQTVQPMAFSRLTHAPRLARVSGADPRPIYFYCALRRKRISLLMVAPPKCRRPLPHIGLRCAICPLNLRCSICASGSPASSPPLDRLTHPWASTSGRLRSGFHACANRA
jgi:hypothetical protein